ncbi:hypothetical protein [Streptomyces sp. SCSIO 30461]|uniref:hypothetical protein n=1 Tax=Streptomyces sp. SCSIO 30461 TaxID=3118085 RepID=UPI00387E6157
MTVNTDLREVLESRRLALALARLPAAAGNGAFDLELFENKGRATAEKTQHPSSKLSARLNRPGAHSR